MHLRLFRCRTAQATAIVTSNGLGGSAKDDAVADREDRIASSRSVL